MKESKAAIGNLWFWWADTLKSTSLKVEVQMIYDLAQFCEVLYKDSSVNLYLAKKQVLHMQFFITDCLKPKIIFFTTIGPNGLYEILYKDSQKLQTSLNSNWIGEWRRLRNVLRYQKGNQKSYIKGQKIIYAEN